MNFDSLKIEFELNSSWTDVTADIIQNYSGRKGIMTSDPAERVADVGQMVFLLRNDANNSAGLIGYYSPEHANARSGFQSNIKVRWTIEKDGISRQKFLGKILPGSIIPTTGIYGQRLTQITVVDWMNETTKTVSLPLITIDKTMGETVEGIIDVMDNAPSETSYDADGITFSSVYDTARKDSKPLTEFSKIAQSGMGWIYVKATNTNGEVLVVEDNTVKGAASVLTIPIGNTDSGRLKLMSGDYLLLQTGDKLILNETQAASFTDEFAGATAGTFQKNRVKMGLIPKDYGASNVVVYELSSAIKIPAGETYDLKGSYKDPDQLAVSVTIRSTTAQVSGVDYIANAERDGTGSNMTSNLTITDLTASVANFTVTLGNDHGTDDLYVTTYRLRGIAVKAYDRLDVVNEDSTSITNYGLVEQVINLPYLTDPDDASTYGASWLAGLKDPHHTIIKVNYLANKNGKLLFMFLAGEVGDLITFSDTMTGITDNYFINGITWTVTNKIIAATYYLIDDSLALLGGA